MSQYLNGHKIRNVANKVKHLDSINDQIVLEILRQFCPTTLQEPRNDSSVFYEEALQAQHIYLDSKLFGPISRVFLLRQLWIVNYDVKTSSNNLSNENINTVVSREIILKK